MAANADADSHRARTADIIPETAGSGSRGSATRTAADPDIRTGRGRTAAQVNATCTGTTASTIQ